MSIFYDIKFIIIEKKLQEMINVMFWNLSFLLCYLINDLLYPEISFSFVIKYVFKIQKIWIYLLILFFYPDGNNNKKL